MTHEITAGDIKQYYHLAPAMYSALETYEGNQIYQDVKYLLKLTEPIRLRLNIWWELGIMVAVQFRGRGVPSQACEGRAPLALNWAPPSM